MANESWVMFGSTAFTLFLGLAYPFNWCEIPYQFNLTLASTYVVFLKYISICLTIAFVHICFLLIWFEKRAEEPYNLIGRLKKTVMEIINYVLAPIMLHQFSDRLSHFYNPCGASGFYLPDGWSFLLALICFTATYHAWTHILHVAHEFNVVMDMVFGSLMQIAVYVAARSNNYYVLMVVLGLYGGYRCFGYLWYSRRSPFRVVDVANLDLEKALIPPSVLP